MDRHAVVATAKSESLPCPECDYAMIAYDRTTDVCPRCGVIVANIARVRAWLRQETGARRAW